ncbi:MAG TPA: hypothetical protein VLJ79_21625 [Candidatus Binatia bacterium]|nr:hypothetical protein [Candidatus Binatia bacterium]
MAFAMTAPLFEFYYQVIEAGFICVVNHSLGFIHCRKVTLFRSFLGPVATVADIGDLRASFRSAMGFLPGAVAAKTSRFFI